MELVSNMDNPIKDAMSCCKEANINSSVSISEIVVWGGGGVSMDQVTQRTAQV